MVAVVMSTGKQVPKLLGQMRVVWLLKKNYEVRGKKLHVNSLSSTSSRAESCQSISSATELVQPHHAPYSPASS
jgi:hypothetical protein